MSRPPAITRHRPPHHDNPTRSAHPVRGYRAIRAAMWILTGVSVTVWILAEFIGEVAARPWIWLFVIVTLTSWPSFAAWCSHRRLTARLDEIEHDGLPRSRAAGYAEGYLDGLLGVDRDA
jgi:hypothetical protein